MRKQQLNLSKNFQTGTGFHFVDRGYFKHFPTRTSAGEGGVEGEDEDGQPSAGITQRLHDKKDHDYLE
ncbi:unnamed protein product, partial [Amoebophrya sp. A120]|eukprot:GSA120T00009865001.1